MFSGFFYPHAECLCALNSEERLMRDVTKNYNPRVRPVLQQNHTVVVTLGMSLHQIIDLVGSKKACVLSNTTRVLYFVCVK